MANTLDWLIERIDSGRMDRVITFGSPEYKPSVHAKVINPATGGIDPNLYNKERRKLYLNDILTNTAITAGIVVGGHVLDGAFDQALSYVDPTNTNIFADSIGDILNGTFRFVLAKEAIGKSKRFSSKTFEFVNKYFALNQIFQPVGKALDASYVGIKDGFNAKELLSVEKLADGFKEAGSNVYKTLTSFAVKGSIAAYTTWDTFKKPVRDYVVRPVKRFFTRNKQDILALGISGTAGYALSRLSPENTPYIMASSLIFGAQFCKNKPVKHIVTWGSLAAATAYGMTEDMVVGAAEKISTSLSDFYEGGKQGFKTLFQLIGGAAIAGLTYVPRHLYSSARSRKDAAILGGATAVAVTGAVLFPEVKEYIVSGVAAASSPLYDSKALRNTTLIGGAGLAFGHSMLGDDHTIRNSTDFAEWGSRKSADMYTGLKYTALATISTIKMGISALLPYGIVKKIRD